jgi:hypothetical protein
VALSRREWLATLGSTLAGLRVLPGLGESRLQAAGASPGPRAGHAMAYHAGRGAVCVLGGYVGRHPRDEVPFFWDGARWARQSATNSGAPFARSHATAVYSKKDSALLYFGGIVLDTGKSSGELWRLKSDGQWVAVREASPGSRDHHQAAYDLRRKKMVVYGGQNWKRQWITDTWEFDGKWHGTPTPSGPGSRTHHAMAFDVLRGRTVLFGGIGEDGMYKPGTWEWDGKSWSQALAEGGPSPRGRHQMVYDLARQETILFGGDTGLLTGNLPALSDQTWAWNGLKWTLKSPQVCPPGRILHAMAYDERRRRVVMYGGGTLGIPGSDTWEWDGEDWRLVND